MTSIDEQFVEFIIKSLVGHPDDVVIERTIDEKGVLLELTVNPDDLGRVIGKRGATAQSVRTLLRALGTKNEARYNLKIVDNGVGAPARDDSSSRSNDEEVAAEEAPSNDEPADTTEEPAEEVEQVEEVAEEEPEQEEESLAEKTRKELDDLDDLDI